MDWHTTGPGFETRLVRYFLPSFQLTTTIPELVERLLVCVEGRGRISRSGLTQDIKLGSCDVPQQWIENNDRSAPCLYTVMGWGVMSYVCDIEFHSGSTFVKVPLLQAGTVAI